MNTGVGYYSFGTMTTGSNNVGLGGYAGMYSGTQGQSNSTTLAGDSIFVGYYSGPAADDQTNQIAIGHQARGRGSNTAQIGNNECTLVYRGAATSTTWNTTSDSRVKEEIEPANLQMCLDTVRDLPVSRWGWREAYINSNDQHVTGWLAEDVERAFPKAVSKRDGYGMKDVRTTDMTEALPTLWGAVQKILERLERLEEKLNG
jgi:hypothetical protein